MVLSQSPNCDASRAVRSQSAFIPRALVPPDDPMAGRPPDDANVADVKTWCSLRTGMIVMS